MRAAFRNLARRVSEHFGDEPEYEVGRKCFVIMFDEKEQGDVAQYGVSGSITWALSSLESIQGKEYRPD